MAAIALTDRIVASTNSLKATLHEYKARNDRLWGRRGRGDPAGKLSCCDWLDWWRVFSPFQVDETPERAAWIVMIRYTKHHVPANAEHYKIEILNTLFYPLLAWSDRFFHASRFRWSIFFFSKGLLCHLSLFFKSIRFRFSNLLFPLCLLSPNWPNCWLFQPTFYMRVDFCSPNKHLSLLSDVQACPAPKIVEFN